MDKEVSYDDYDKDEKEEFIDDPGDLDDIPAGVVYTNYFSDISPPDNPKEILMERDDDRPVYTTRERGRTVERRNCTLEAFFGARIIAPGVSYDKSPKIRFAELKPQLLMSFKGKLGLKIRVTRVCDFPGTLTIQFDRSAATNPATITISGNSLKEIKTQIKSKDEVAVSPPSTVTSTNTTVDETITARVTWNPQGADPCYLEETLLITWFYQDPRQRFRSKVLNSTSGNSSGTKVRTGKTLTKQTRDGADWHTVPLFTTWSVKDVTKCCDTRGEHVVIQFVRHEYDLNGVPEGGDKWSLDIQDSEIQRARGNQPYDPTYTHNPRGQGNAAPIVYPGPDSNGKPSINQIDGPGMSGPLYDRFKRKGGTFKWEFVSFLVCKLDDSSANNYLQNGLVTQMLEFSIEITFRRGRTPTVSGRRSRRRNMQCKKLSEVIAQYDRTHRGDGDLIDGYNSPEDHTVGLPAE